MASCGTAKNSWPELVGIHGDAAAAIIKGENPELEVMIIEKTMAVTTDFRCNRVRVRVDEKGNVFLAPKIG